VKKANRLQQHKIEGPFGKKLSGR